MAYLLAGSTIRNPLEIDEGNSTQVAQQRTLLGTIGRDYFGKNKRIWTLNFENAKKAEYDTINAIYQSYLSTGSTKSWQVTEANYPISLTQVHVNLDLRSFRIRGSDYLSNFTLTLTEA